MSFSFSPGLIVDVLHAILIGGIVAVRYLWPVWLVIIGLWLLTRILKGLSSWLGFNPAPSRRAAKPVSRTRR